MPIIIVNNKHIQLITYVITLLLQAIYSMQETSKNEFLRLTFKVIQYNDSLIDDNKEIDYRNLVFNFYNDLLCLLDDTMWPISEKILYLYLKYHSDIIKLDKTFNALHIKILSNICDKIQKIKNSNQIDVFPTKIESLSKYECCNIPFICEDKKLDVICSYCNNIFHRKCVNLNSNIDNWLCKKCNIYKFGINQIDTINDLLYKMMQIKKIDYTPIYNEYITKQLILTYCNWNIYQYDSYEYNTARNTYLYDFMHEQNKKYVKFYEYQEDYKKLPPQFYVFLYYYKIVYRIK